MWFLGLIFGAVVGAIGGWGGALVGAVVGAVIGSALSTRSAGSNDERLAAIDEAIRKLNERVAALEQGTRPGKAEGPEQIAPAGHAPTASRPPVPDEVIAAGIAGLDAIPVSPARDSAAPVAAAREAQPPAPGPSGEVPRPIADGPSTAGRTQLIGVIVGAVVGFAWGFVGAVVCGFLGWVIAMIIIANQRPDATPQPRPESEGGRAQGVAEPVVHPEAPSPLAPSEPETTAAPTLTHERAAAAPGAPVDAPADAAPGWIQRLVSGNIVAKVGVVILFFGVGFLLKYAYDHSLLPVWLRLIGVAVAGIAMALVGWRLRVTRRLYGLILQGGGIGLLYLDVYFALRTYPDVFGMPAAFAGFMLLGVAATLLAVRQDAKILAVLGLTGAFLAPVLASAKTGNHVMLFSYYTLLNGFILTISWFKAWRDLNLVGFIFTFVVGLLWGANNYRPELFATVEPFVLIFFAMYLVIPILFAQQQPPELKGLVDGTLVFGTPITVAFMQAGLVKDMPYGLAWSAGCAALLYALLAGTTLRRDGMRLLGETYVALAIVFLTLAIFFAFDAYPTFALWTLEGAAVIWVGLRQRRLLARLFGLALQLAGAIYFLIKYPDYRLENPWFNDFVVGCVIIAASGFIIAWLMHRHRDAFDANVEPGGGVLVAWGGLWWAIAGAHSLHHAYPWATFLIALLAFIAATFAVVELLGSWLQWPDLRRLSHAHLPGLVAVAAMQFMVNPPLPLGGFGRPLADGGYWAWPVNFVVLFWVCQRQLRAGILPADSVRYGLAWWLIAVLATWDASWLLTHRDYWGVLAWGGAGMVAATLRFLWRERGTSDAPRYGAWILLWGIVWWFIGGAGLVDRYIEPTLQTASHLAFAAATFLVAEWLGRFLGWEALRAVTVAHVPAMIGILLLTVEPGEQPLGDGGLLAWPASFVVLYWTLHRQRQDGVAIADAARYWVGFVLVATVATREVLWQLDHQRYAWALAWSALGMLAGYVRFRLRERDNPDVTPISLVALAWGVGFWFLSGFSWIATELGTAATVAATLGFVAVSCGLFEAAGSFASWPALRRTVLLVPVTMVIVALVQFADYSHPFAAHGWLAWLVSFATLYAAMFRHERDGIVVLGGPQHALALWLGALVLTWETSWQFDAHGLGKAWVRPAWSAIPALFVLSVSAFSGRHTWPFGRHYSALYRSVLAPVALLIAAWSLYFNLAAPGPMAPASYLPLLNPIDVAQFAVLFAIWRWCGTFDGNTGFSRATMMPFLAGLVFLWVNCIVLRSIHFWVGIEYRFDALMNSVVVQSAFSLLWTTTALVLMLHATRNARRKNWMVGAALLAVVVAKLFLLDLANSGTVERIVSFIGVGIGLLAIGYFAPVPPGEREQEAG